MNAVRPQFLDDTLPPFRAQYLTTISTNLPMLLEEFGRHVLGGFSPEKDRKYLVATTFAEVTGAEACPVYDDLTARLSRLAGERREELLYSLRRTIVQKEDEAKRFGEDIGSLLSNLRALEGTKNPVINGIVNFGISRVDQDFRALQDESHAVRDIYGVMVDLVRAHYDKAPRSPTH